MEKLIDSVRELKEKKEIRKRIDARMKEFKENGKKESPEIFNQLCFCILTANFNAKRTIEIEEKMGDGFLTLPEKKLAARLKALGHRYPNARASYITHSRKYKDDIKEIIGSMNRKDARDWLAKNIKGLGYKEASHFLRNTGCNDFAIIDFHIVDILADNGIIKRPKYLSKKTYIAIEKKLGKIAKEAGLTQGELDMYLWCMETGKILK
jgi:N-glycosylase/DNA lyase